MEAMQDRLGRAHGEGCVMKRGGGREGALRMLSMLEDCFDVFDIQFFGRALFIPAAQTSRRCLKKEDKKKRGIRKGNVHKGKIGTERTHTNEDGGWGSTGQCEEEDAPSK